MEGIVVQLGGQREAMQGKAKEKRGEPNRVHAVEVRGGGNR